MKDRENTYEGVLDDLNFCHQYPQIMPDYYPPITSPDPDLPRGVIIFSESFLHVAIFLFLVGAVNCYMRAGDLVTSVVFGTEIALGVAHTTVTALTFYPGCHTTLRTPLYRVLQSFDFVIVVQDDTEWDEASWLSRSY